MAMNRQSDLISNRMIFSKRMFLSFLVFLAFGSTPLVYGQEIENKKEKVLKLSYQIDPTSKKRKQENIRKLKQLLVSILRTAFQNSNGNLQEVNKNVSKQITSDLSHIYNCVKKENRDESPFLVCSINLPIQGPSSRLEKLYLYTIYRRDGKDNGNWILQEVPFNKEGKKIRSWGAEKLRFIELTNLFSGDEYQDDILLITSRRKGRGRREATAFSLWKIGKEKNRCLLGKAEPYSTRHLVNKSGFLFEIGTHYTGTTAPPYGRKVWINTYFLNPKGNLVKREGNKFKLRYKPSKEQVQETKKNLDSEKEIKKYDQFLKKWRESGKFGNE